VQQQSHSAVWKKPDRSFPAIKSNRTVQLDYPQHASPRTYIFAEERECLEVCSDHSYLDSEAQEGD
jgi:hypothetical protein